MTRTPQVLRGRAAARAATSATTYREDRPLVIWPADRARWPGSTSDAIIQITARLVDQRSANPRRTVFSAGMHWGSRQELGLRGQVRLMHSFGLPESPPSRS